MIENKRLNDACAAHVRSVRAAHGLTLEQVARAARRRGMTWSTGSVSNLEAGKVALTLPVLVVLADVLTELASEHRVDDVFGDADALELTPTLTIDRHALRNILGGAVVRLDDEAAVGIGRTVEIVETVREQTKGAPKGTTAQEHGAVREWPVTLADERAAERLELSAHALQLWALRLWGRPLEAEAAARAGESATPQKRGHATRELMGEVEAAYRAERPKEWQRNNPPKVNRGSRNTATPCVTGSCLG